MYILKVNGDTYKVAYSYRVLATTDILDKLQEVMAGQGDGMKTAKATLVFIPELLLYGLQKFHKDKFGFVDDEEKEEKLDMVYDIIDMYEEEHSSDEVAEEEVKPDAFTILGELISELKKQGFFSRLSLEMEQDAETMDATVVPMDHQKKTRKKVGVKQ